MKKMLLGFLLVLSSVSRAGDSSCTSVTHVTAAGDYYASLSDCIISIEKTTFEATYVWLPSDTTSGDKYTVTDNTAYTLDSCENDGTEQEPLWVCSPAGVTVQSVDSGTGVTVDTTESTTLSGLYYQGSPTRQNVTLILNGTNWDATYGHHY